MATCRTLEVTNSSFTSTEHQVVSIPNVFVTQTQRVPWFARHRCHKSQERSFSETPFRGQGQSMWRRTSQPGHQFGHAVQRGHGCHLNSILIGTRVEKSLRENLNPCGAAPKQRAVLLPDAWLSFPGTLQDLLKKLRGTGLQLLTGKRTKARNIYPVLAAQPPEAPCWEHQTQGLPGG